jgi:hypothetical protein
MFLSLKRYFMHGVIDIKTMIVLALLIAAFSLPSCLGQTNDGGAVDAQTYINLSNTALAYYSQDLNYSSMIVDEFTKGTISGRDAMTATTTLYVLSLKTYVDLASISRPSGEAFDTYSNDLGQTFGNYQMYLWLLMKYFETGDRSFATAAASKINDSYSYFQKALEDQAAITAATTQTATPVSAGNVATTAGTSSGSVPVNLTPNSQGFVDVSSVGSSYLN